MSKPKADSVDRRNFLKTAAAGAAAAATTGYRTAEAQTQPPNPLLGAPPVGARAAEPGAAPTEAELIERPGSNFMVDVLKSLNYEYVFSNPASSFRSLHESIINYGNNSAPEFITCCHEEIAAGMAHGYAKIEGRPALVLVHGTVGLQHATMAIYDAFCDRVPMCIVLGNMLDAAERGSFVEWVHSAQDAASIIRDYVKWDDTPASLRHFAESAVRAYKISVTPPMGPVALTVDAGLQERPAAPDRNLQVPKLGTLAPPQADSGAIAELARLLVAAEHPVLVVDRLARTPNGLTHLVELAETLQAAVIDRKGRMNFPSQHPLEQSGSRMGLADADLIVGLEVFDFAGTRSTRPGAKKISISSNDLFTRSNYQDFQRFVQADLAIAADGEATLPALVEAVKRLTTDDRRRFFQDRGAKLAKAHDDAHRQFRENATFGWDGSPISTARVSMELWAQLKDEDWSLASDVAFFGNWPLRLWKFDKHYQYIGGPGGYGIGYGAPAALGAALANKKHGRLTVNVQNDGDLLFVPGALWTAAHHRIPLLTIMHNNRAYHQEVMHVVRMCLEHGHDTARAHIGTRIDDPPVNFAKVAEGMGVHGEGPISDPKDLGPAIRRALEIVKKGQPALIDVLTQPR